MQPQVVQYIKDARVKGISDAEIRKDLLGVGWTGTVVEASFSEASKSETPIEKQKPAQPVELKQSKPQTKPMVSEKIPLKEVPAIKKDIKQITKPSSDPTATDVVTQVDNKIPGQTFVPQKEPASKKTAVGVVFQIILALTLFGVIGYAGYVYVWPMVSSYLPGGSEITIDEVSMYPYAVDTFFDDVGSHITEIQNGEYSLVYAAKHASRGLNVQSAEERFPEYVPVGADSIDTESVITSFIRSEKAYATITAENPVAVQGRIIDGEVYVNVKNTPVDFEFQKTGEWVMAYDLKTLPMLPALVSAVKESRVLEVVGVPKRDVFEGGVATRYTLSLNSASIPAFYATLRSLIANTTAAVDMSQRAEDFMKYVAMFEEDANITDFFSLLGAQLKIYVWIDNERLIPVRLAVVGPIVPGATDMQVNAGISIERNVSGTLLEKPSDVKEIDKHLLYYLGF